MKDKKYLVAGTGISGIGAANLLLKIGAQVTVYDGNESLDKEEIAKKLIADGVEIILGALPQEVIKGTDVMILSPELQLMLHL